MLEWLFPKDNRKIHRNIEIPKIEYNNIEPPRNRTQQHIQTQHNNVDLNYETPKDTLLIKEVEPENKIKAIVDEFIITIRNHDDFRNAFRVDDLAILLVYLYNENTVTLDLNSTIENVFDTIQNEQGNILDRTDPEVVSNAFRIITLRMMPLIDTSIIYTVSKLRWLYTSNVNLNFRVYTIPNRKFINVSFNLLPQLPGIEGMTINTIPFMKAFNDLIMESRNIIEYGKNNNL